jgi:hypothetical protein
LRNLGAEAGEGAKDLQTAAHHDEERNRVEPMAKAHRQRVLVGCAPDCLGFVALGLRNFDYRAAHALPPIEVINKVINNWSVLLPAALDSDVELDRAPLLTPVHWDQQQSKVKSKIKDRNKSKDKINNKIKSKNKIKRGGQECPPHMTIHISHSP